MKKRSLSFWIVVGMIAGVLSGVLFGKFEIVLSLAVFTSDFFLRLLNMMVIPIIIVSIVNGVISSGKPDNFKRLGFKTFIYVIFTSSLAILLGLFLVNLLKPGIGADLGLKLNVGTISQSLSLGEIIMNLVPVNIIDSMVKGDVLPVIFFFTLFAYFATKYKEHAKDSVKDIFHAGYDITMKITMFIMWFAPVGIWGMLTKVVATTGYHAIRPLLLYFICVLLGLFMHSFITLNLIVKLVARKSPFKLLKAMSPALLTGFSTASSNATLPVTIECAEGRANISKKVTSFVLPLGVTIIKDGTALFECVAVVFIAQAYGIMLSANQQFIVVVTSLLASIGAAGIPMAGLVMMSVILSACGLPLEGIGLILAVDRLLDMFRTAVNIWSNSCNAVIVGVLEGEKNILKKNL